jgi:glycosyl transferase family 25
MSIKCLDDIKNVYYINLEYRTDRKDHIEEQLSKLGLKGERFNAIKMVDGAIGCSLSHLKLLENALKNKMDHILILEDDITFLDYKLFIKQFNHFLELHENNWDIILFAGNNMVPYERVDNTCIKVSRCQTTTGYLVNGHYINVLKENVKMGLTNLLHNPSEKNKYAIDKFWFNLQNVNDWYLITPATVVQRKDYSDIENKITNYQNSMLNIDKCVM